MTAQLFQSIQSITKMLAPQPNHKRKNAVPPALNRKNGVEQQTLPSILSLKEKMPKAEVL